MELHCLTPYSCFIAWLLHIYLVTSKKNFPTKTASACIRELTKRDQKMALVKHVVRATGRAVFPCRLNVSAAFFRAEITISVLLNDLILPLQLRLPLVSGNTTTEQDHLSSGNRGYCQIAFRGTLVKRFREQTIPY